MLYRAKVRKPTGVDRTPGGKGRARRRASTALVAATAVVAVAATMASADVESESSRGYGAKDLRRDLLAVHQAGDGTVNVVARLDDTRGTTEAKIEAEGDQRNALPDNAQFRLASTSKTYMAVVVLQLAAEGKLSLDDTVEQWLPGMLRSNGYDGSRVTVRHLLGHTSGIFDTMRDPGIRDRIFLHFEENRYDATSSAELIATALRHPPVFVPDPSGPVQFAYSNTNYLLAAMIAERAAGGVSWRDLIEARIIGPLGLRDTYTSGVNPFIDEPHAGVRLNLPDGRNHDVTEHSIQHTADTGIVATPAYRALVTGRLLPAEMWHEMRQASEATRGHGLGIEEVPLSCGGVYYKREGDGLGVTSRPAVTADGSRAITITVTTTADSPDDDRLDAAVGALIDHAFCAPQGH